MVSKIIIKIKECRGFIKKQALVAPNYFNLLQTCGKVNALIWLDAPNYRNKHSIPND